MKKILILFAVMALIGIVIALYFAISAIGMFAVEFAWISMLN